MRDAVRIMNRHIRVPAALVMLFLIAIVAPAGATVQDDAADDGITLMATEPRANAVLPAAPETLALTFSTDVDPDESTIRLYGRNGAEVETAGVSWRDPQTATVSFTEEIPHGSYLVAWDVSASGAASGSGFYGFTVGTDQDVAPVTIPDTGFSASGPPGWVSAGAHAVLTLGMFLLLAIWPVWTLVLAPGATATMPMRMQQIAVTGAILMAVGIASRIAIGAWVSGDGSWLYRLLTTIGETRTGQLLIVALVTLSIHSLALALASWNDSDASKWSRALPWLTTFALAIPIVLLSHAADEPAGRIPTLTATWLAYAAAGMLAGGLVVLAWANAWKSSARFGTMAAIAIPTLAITGGYLGWLFVGNRTALEETTYGRVYLFTAILGVLLALAAAAALLVMRHRESPRLLVVPALIALAFTVGIGSLTSLDTARASLERDTTQRAVPFTLDDERAQLVLAPGAAGVNHMRLEIDRGSIPRQTAASLTMSLPSKPELGTETVTLSRVSDNAFEYHGTELTIADQWDLEITMTEPGRDPVQGESTLDLDLTATSVDLPAVPWRFTDLAGSAGFIMIVFGVAGAVIGVTAGKSPLRKESTGLGLAALLFAAILLGQGRLDPILASGGDADGGAINPDDLAMITRGESIYEQHCLSCHGPELRGDGPAADGMQPPPADFAEAHTMVHDEATLVYWVRNGKQGTAMPGFGDTLTDQEIRDVLSFVERRQRAFASESTVPAPEMCTVTPRADDEINSLAALTAEDGAAGELIPADDPDVSNATRDAVTTTITETIACLNAGDIPRATALLTDSAVGWVFSAGREPIETPSPLPEDERIEVASLSNFTTLSGDRVAVQVTVRDPHGALEPLTPTFSASDEIQEVTVVLVRSGSGWNIDEIRP